MAADPDQSTLLDEPAGESEPATNAFSLWVIASTDRRLVGTCHPLSRDEPFLLGRRIERGGLSAEDPRMSRVHARLAWDGRTSSFRLRDAGSANGTFSNGRRVEVADLASGSVVRTGETVCVFVEGDPTAEQQHRLARIAKTEHAVLLTGETGTGKELAARRIHEVSGRVGVFVAVNCATLPRDLAAAELFGHQRGAFSGAATERLGLFRAAHRGTLFLDEIGDLPLDLQPVLLRVLEEKSVRPVGSEREVPVDVRVIAATHQDLRDKCEQGTFRLDLLARLTQEEVRLAPLRERMHELPVLLRELAAQVGLPELEVTTGAMEAIALGAWSENVRGLRKVIARLRTFGEPPYVLTRPFLEGEAPDLFPLTSSSLPPRATERPSERESVAPGLTRSDLEVLLERHGGRVAAVAEELGSSRVHVYRLLKRFGLEPPTRREQ